MATGHLLHTFTCVLYYVNTERVVSDVNNETTSAYATCGYER